MTYVVHALYKSPIRHGDDFSVSYSSISDMPSGQSATLTTAQSSCALRAAVATVLVLVLVYCAASWHSRRGRDGFVSPRAHEVYRVTQDLFTRTNGAATYSEYKSALDGADPVLYSDVRHLWRAGRLTPAGVASALGDN